LCLFEGIEEFFKELVVFIWLPPKEISAAKFGE